MRKIGRTAKGGGRVPFVATHHPSFNRSGKAVRRLRPMLTNSEEHREVFLEQFSMRYIVKHVSLCRIVQSLLSIQSCNDGSWPQ